MQPILYDYGRMRRAKDYIIFPLDFSDYENVVRYVQMLKDYVGVFKIGLELFICQGPGIVGSIRSICNNKIFLDLKLHDIPETVKRSIIALSQYRPDFITVHPELPKGFLKDMEMFQTKILGVTLLTSVDKDMLDLIGYSTADVTDLVIKRARLAKEIGCHGIVCSGHEVKRIKEELGEDFIAVVPGIRPAWFVSRDDQRRVVTPKDAIMLGADYIVVGRPIKNAKDPKGAVLKIIEEIDSAINEKGLL